LTFLGGQPKTPIVATIVYDSASVRQHPTLASPRKTIGQTDAMVVVDFGSPRSRNNFEPQRLKSSVL
jgi:hypothetical protein